MIFVLNILRDQADIEISEGKYSIFRIFSIKQMIKIKLMLIFFLNWHVIEQNTWGDALWVWICTDSNKVRDSLQSICSLTLFFLKLTVSVDLKGEEHAQLEYVIFIQRTAPLENSSEVIWMFGDDHGNKWKKMRVSWLQQEDGGVALVLRGDVYDDEEKSRSELSGQKKLLSHRSSTVELRRRDSSSVCWLCVGGGCFLGSEVVLPDVFARSSNVGWSLNCSGFEAETVSNCSSRRKKMFVWQGQRSLLVLSTGDEKVSAEKLFSLLSICLWRKSPTVHLSKCRLHWNQFD